MFVANLKLFWLKLARLFFLYIDFWFSVPFLKSLLLRSLKRHPCKRRALNLDIDGFFLVPTPAVVARNFRAPERLPTFTSSAWLRNNTPTPHTPTHTHLGEWRGPWSWIISLVEVLSEKPTKDIFQSVELRNTHRGGGAGAYGIRPASRKLGVRIPAATETHSDSSTAKRSALDASVTGPRRWRFLNGFPVSQ